MKHHIILISSLLLLVSLLAGCFDEPTPASQTVPKENLIYLTEKGLADLSTCGFGESTRQTVTYVNLDRNALTNIVPLADHCAIKWLRLNDNRLESLPDLRAMVNLRRIYLKNNRLTAVPPTLKDLPALTDVELSGNPISEIPDWFAAKPNLKNVSLNRTRITKLPDNLEAWKCLQSLQLGDLKLSSEEMARIRKALPKVAVVF